CRQAPAVNSNTANSSSGDVVIGNLNNPSDPNEAMSFTNPARYNAVKVHVKRTSSQNGEVPLFFARVMGIASESLEASGTAALINNFKGFKTPGQAGTTLNLLPYAIAK